ncbi:MAG: hypothetical protein DWI00_11580 [Planctomycetota bacterium]|nr:MAG: hypothetical protein DWI00_11580 [Planctomycetota bacterium]
MPAWPRTPLVLQSGKGIENAVLAERGSLCQFAQSAHLRARAFGTIGNGGPSLGRCASFENLQTGISDDELQ